MIAQSEVKSRLWGSCIFIFQIVIISQSIRRVTRFRICCRSPVFLGKVSYGKGCSRFQVEFPQMKYAGDISPATIIFSEAT